LKVEDNGGDNGLRRHNVDHCVALDTQPKGSEAGACDSNECNEWPAWKLALP